MTERTLSRPSAADPPRLGVADFDDDLQHQRPSAEAWIMHSGFIGSAHTLSPWSPPGLNDYAVFARPAPTWPLVAHHPQLKDSIPNQCKRRRRLEGIRSSDGAPVGAGPSQPRAFSSLP